MIAYDCICRLNTPICWITFHRKEIPHAPFVPATRLFVVEWRLELMTPNFNAFAVLAIVLKIEPNKLFPFHFSRISGIFLQLVQSLRLWIIFGSLIQMGPQDA